MSIEFNVMETKRFGIRCARVVDPHAPLEDVNAAARADKIVFLSIRVATDDISRVQNLEDDGYRLMDTIVYYHTDLTTRSPVHSSIDGVSIRAANLSDIDGVGLVAAKAFSGFFGHFHADTRLSKSDADAVYVDWAKTCVKKSEADLPVIVATVEKDIVGFLAAQKTSDTSADIALNAVAPEMQRRGIYGGLLDQGLQQLELAGCKSTTISTQINNIPVQKAWGKRGFRMHSSFYTLHKWMSD